MNVCPYTTDKTVIVYQMSKCMIQKQKWDADIIEKLPTAYEFFMMQNLIHNHFDKSWQSHCIILKIKDAILHN